MSQHRPFPVSRLPVLDPVPISPPETLRPGCSAGHPTLAEAYCRQRGLPAAEFERALLRETLPPAARRARFLLALIPRYFEPDLIFIHHVGRLRRLDDLSYEEIEFRQDRANRSFLRGRLRLRVSTRRLRQVVERVFGDRTRELSPLLSSLVQSCLRPDDSCPPGVA